MKSLYPIIEAGPIAFIPDTECPDYLHMILNPTSCFTPPIVTFKEMHEAEYKDEYKYFIYGLLQNKTLPLGKLSRYDYEDICIQDIEFKTIRLNRIGKTTFRYSSVVQVIFSVATARGCITISEWYMIPGQYDTRDGIWLFQNIHVYDSSSAPVSDMTDYLVPKITDYEYEAKRMLSFFQSEALKKPCRINAESMAKKMKFSVRYVRLSPDNSVQGKIVFSKATLTLYNKDGIPYTEDIYENTIFIDKAACKKHGCTVRTAIIHECVHAFEHLFFFDLQSLYCEKVAEYNGLSFEDFLQTNETAICVRNMEQQAARMTPRVLMPEETFMIKAKEYLEIFHNFSRETQMEKTIKSLAAYFDASIDMTKHRMQELGFQVQGILEYADGQYVPSFQADIPLPNNITYTIPLLGLLEEAERNPEFDKILTSGRYIHIEGHLCIRDDKYICKKDGKPVLSDYAHKHLSECCMPFEVCHRTDYQFAPGTLNKETADDLEYHHSAEFYQNLLAEIKESRVEEVQAPEEFFDAFVYYKEKKKYSNLVISLISHISKSRVDRIANSNEKKRQHPCYYDTTALGMTLCPTPDLVIDLTEKAGYSTYKTNEQRFITRCVFALFGRDIDDFNFAMTSAGFKPLVDETDN